jgi:hypothetical protein
MTFLACKQLPGLALRGQAHGFIPVRGREFKESVKAIQAPGREPANSGIRVPECNLLKVRIIRIQQADGFSTNGRVAVTPSWRK